MARLRNLLFVLLVLAALAAMGYGQYGLRINSEDAHATAIFLVAAMVAALLLGWQGTSDSDPPEGATADSTPHSKFARFGVALGIAVIATASVLLSTSWDRWYLDGWLLLLGGVLMLSLALRRFDPPSRGERPWSRTEIVVVVALVLLGGVLRFYRYTDFPDPFSMHAIEEPQTGQGAYKILTEHVHPWEFMVDYYVAALAIYLRHDPSILSIRIPFTIFSILTIVPVYFLLRQLVSFPAAVGGTFLFAVSSWNIIYSRCAHPIFLPNFFVVAVFALLIHFGRTRRLAGIPWAGVLGASTLYAYAGYRGTSIFALVFCAGVFVRDVLRYTRIRDSAAKLASALLVFRDLSAAAILVGLIVALAVPIIVLTTSNAAQPNYYFEAAIRSLNNHEYYTHDRSAFMAQRLQRIREAARLFMHRGDGSLTFNEPDEPMLDPVTSVLFVGGLLLAVSYPLQRFHGFLLFLFLALMFGSTVFVQNLDPRRMQGITPLVAVFAAVFLDRLWGAAQRLPAAIHRGIVPVLAVAAAGFALWWNYDVYFHKMAHDPRTRQAFKNYYTTLIHYGRTEGTGHDMILLSEARHFFWHSDYSWMVQDVMHGTNAADLGVLLSGLPEPRGGPRTILIQQPQERHAIAALLSELYPGTACHDFLEPDNLYIALTACDLPDPPVKQELHATLEARYWLHDRPVGEPFLVRQEPFIAFALVPPTCYEPTSPGSNYCYAEWSGTFDVPTEGDYPFVTTVRGTTTMEVRIDGEPLPPFPPEAPGKIIHLAAGTHQVVAHARIPRTNETGARLEWKRGPERTAVPFYRITRPQPVEVNAEAPSGEAAHQDGARPE